MKARLYRPIIIILLLGAFMAEAQLISKPLKEIPKAEDVIAFSNTQPSDAVQPKRLKKEDILKFLREGKVQLNPSRWHLDFPREKGLELSGGVIATKDGKVFFWFLSSKKSLMLSNDEGESCLLGIP